MRIEKYDNNHGTSGCYMCKKRAAFWKAYLRISTLGKDIAENTVMVLLCSECVKLNEDQLRIFFLG